MMIGAFQKSVIHRQCVEAARTWLISCWLEKKEIPGEVTYYAYGDGPESMDWGCNRDDPDAPLIGRRVSITMKVEDWPDVTD